MPLYDFHCAACDFWLETIAKPEENVVCPLCLHMMDRQIPKPSKPIFKGGERFSATADIKPKTEKS